VQLHAGDASALELHHVLRQGAGLVGEHVLDLAQLLKKNDIVMRAVF
jgi:hypothetical protein